jgi:hypothetical protein
MMAFPLRIAARMNQATHSKIVSFPWGTRYFYQPRPLLTLEEIRADTPAVQKEAEGLLDELLQGASR